MKSPLITCPNCTNVSISEIPVIDILMLRELAVSEVKKGRRVAGFFAAKINDQRRIICVLADNRSSSLAVTSSMIEEDWYPSFTPDCEQFHWFERSLFEEIKLRPTGHPWLKPIRFSEGGDHKIGITDFYTIEGEEIHEVAVGPVHAGVIEPGHFRFQCHGEKVFHLEISLGYQHRGIENAILGGPDTKTVYLMETAAGDSSIAHSTAYCSLIEDLQRDALEISEQSGLWRAIALELERIANHTGDIGALAGDVGFLPTSSYCGRIRGDFLNLTALLCGNRFGRGFVRPGGIGCTITEDKINNLKHRLATAKKDIYSAIKPLWSASSVSSRFHDTGRLTFEDCLNLGIIGPPASACGLRMDARTDFPTGIYKTRPINVSSSESGDVWARARIRWHEIRESICYIEKLLQEALPVERVKSAEQVCLKSDALSIGLVEGWRGEVCHIALTGSDGKFSCYKIFDPSFHNWFGLAQCLRGEQISDFPLCNKSFNLSYCGHDL